LHPVNSFWTPPRPPWSRASSRRHQARRQLDVWTKIEGAQKYKVFFSTSDNDCKSGPGVIERESQFNFLLASGLQPETHYFIEVLPIGPNDFAGAPSVGACFKQAVRYAGATGTVRVLPSRFANLRLLRERRAGLGVARVRFNPTTIGCKYSPS